MTGSPVILCLLCLSGHLVLQGESCKGPTPPRKAGTQQNNSGSINLNNRQPAPLADQTLDSAEPVCSSLFSTFMTLSCPRIAAQGCTVPRRLHCDPLARQRQRREELRMHEAIDAVQVIIVLATSSGGSSYRYTRSCLGWQLNGPHRAT